MQTPSGYMKKHEMLLEIYHTKSHENSECIYDEQFRLLEKEYCQIRGLQEKTDSVVSFGKAVQNYIKEIDLILKSKGGRL